MPTNVTVNSNYAGKDAGMIFREAFKETDTLRLGLISVFENVNFKLNMRLLQTTTGTQDYACIADGGFSTVASGSVTLSERVLEPVKLMNAFQVCKEDFRTQWSEELMGASAHNPNLPADILEAIQLDQLEQVAIETNSKIWNGDSANDAEWDGFVKLFNADSDVIKANNGIVPLGSAITEDNVLDEIKKALAALPVKMRRRDLQVLVSPDVFQAYSFYLITRGILDNGTADEKQVKFGRYTITEVNDLEDNTIVIYDKPNLAFGTGLLGDHNRLEIVDEDEIGLLTGQVRGKMVFNGGVQYAFGGEIVYYKADTTPA